MHQQHVYLMGGRFALVLTLDDGSPAIIGTADPDAFERAMERCWRQVRQ